MEKEKKYMSLKWKITFTIMPFVGVISIVVFGLTYLFTKELTVKGVTASQNAEGYVSVDQVTAALSGSWYLWVIGVLLVILLTDLVCVLVVDRRMKGLKQTKEDIAAITNGNFTVKVPECKSKWEDEIADINENLGEFIKKMDRLLREIGITTAKLSEHSERFSLMAEELNEDANSQSGALDELTTTMEGMAECIQNLAQSATDLAGIAGKTHDSGVETNRRMQDMVQASMKTGEDMETVTGSMEHVVNSMEELTQLVVDVSQAASEINSITEVIKEIADQTNLLSLNASIEAARAGESGKGFAVVAAEIKNLADTSGKNAKAIEKLTGNISELIQKTEVSTKQSRDDIQKSSGLLKEATAAFRTIMDVADNTGKVLEGLTEEIDKVNDIAVDMAAITEEQAASSQEVLATTVSVDQLVAKTKEKSAGIQKGTEALHIASSDLNREMQYFAI